MPLVSNNGEFLKSYKGTSQPRNSSFKHKMVVRRQVLISERLYQLIMGTLLEAATRSPDLHVLAGRPHLLDRIVKEW
jgi:hypothetical protein